MKTRRFQTDQLAVTGISRLLLKVIHYEPANDKYLVEQVYIKFGWSSMWIEGYRLNPVF